MSQQKRPLALLDNAFLLTETTEAPKHIASLFYYEKPADSGEDYAYQLYNHWLGCNTATAPFNWKLAGINPLRPFWIEDDNFDIARHLRFHRLPDQASEQQLLNKVGELHEEPLKRDRPVWSLHIIDGLAGDRFAMYFSLHHALIDGMTAMSMIAIAHDNKPLKDSLPLWQRDYPDFKLSDQSWLQRQQKMLTGRIDAAQKSAKNLVGLGHLSMQLIKEAVGINETPLTIPFSAKDCLLNGDASSQRSLATACLPLDQVKLVCHQSGGSLNHVVLTCVDEAMHRYLGDIGAPLDAPLHVNIPVSLRGKEESDQAGNSVAALPVSLADADCDLSGRFEEIGKSLTGLRDLVENNSKSSLETYSLLTGALAQSLETTSTQSLAPGAAHFLVSNVPGPRQTLFQGEAALLNWYPVSALYPGQRINVTLLSYDGKLYFGVVASAEFLPRIELLTTYIEAAFASLAKEFLPAKPSKTKNKSARKKTAA
ncbi:MAG: wax ester/triacylglycerol synthase family O-acyltransferase [Candidatus Pelagadaptatus aseana]|uniref:wax ester/triacylglycerol synthase family O-acyltransferase n=1 Tax=Candidatus Pelagadaptatus aseana TaxID=3120508 RepID=UPI0039B266C6